MRDTRPIEEQVAELTQEQQNNVVRAFHWDTCYCLWTTAALSLVIFLIVKDNPFFVFVPAKFQIALLGAIAMFVMVVVFIVWKIVVAVAIPYYNKHKARYILKMRQQRK